MNSNYDMGHALKNDTDQCKEKFMGTCDYYGCHKHDTHAIEFKGKRNPYCWALVLWLNWCLGSQHSVLCERSREDVWTVRMSNISKRLPRRCLHKLRLSIGNMEELTKYEDYKQHPWLLTSFSSTLKTIQVDARNNNACALGWQDCSVRNGSGWQDWWSLFDLPNPHGTKREATPTSCPLIYTCMPW